MSTLAAAGRRVRRGGVHIDDPIVYLYSSYVIPRHLAATLRRTAGGFPVLSVTGPRQSGKTTLLRNLFPRLGYVSLEQPDERRFAIEDPRGFLRHHSAAGVILDEVQHVPDHQP